MAGCGQIVDVGQESANLFQADEEFARTSVEKGSAEAFYLFLTDEAIQLPRNGGPVVGRETIRESMSQGPKLTLTWEPKKAEVAASGDMGYTWGTYAAEWTGADGTENVRNGKYVNIWKKQPDGTWKVALDMGNQSSLPVEASN
jgi:ketosteroid isomerase-like protein